MKGTGIWILLLLMAASCGQAQGISRSTGIGFRGGIFNSGDKAKTFVNQNTVQVSGFSGSLFFFSRLSSNFFFESNIGALLDEVNVEGSAMDTSDVHVSTVIPLLFGLRYDLMPTRIGTFFRPYVGAGAGPYWLINVQDRTVLDEIATESSVDSDYQFGWYLAAGVNLVFQSWVALNTDIRYHFFDFQQDEISGGMEFSLGFSFMWGKKKEMFEVEDVRLIVQDIYPAYYQFYNTYPLAFIEVKNTVSYPIEINALSQIKGYTERQAESGFVSIAPGETRSIPIKAFFGSSLLNASQRKPAVIDLELVARAGAEQKKTVSRQLIVHSRNGWNGEIDKLGFFVTPDADSILNLSRKTMDNLQQGAGELTQSFYLGRSLFDTLSARSIGYRSDPNIPFYQDDRVQFAMETLTTLGGDCDDLVVLYSSVLESAGIRTAFVDVQDPAKPVAHVFLLFDSGLTPDQGALISGNEKKYVIRQNQAGEARIWIPVETTLIQQGFDAAWRSGAMQYLQDGILNHGLDEGWMKVIDLNRLSVNNSF